MDTELDEMQSLGVVGICKEAFGIVKLHVRLFLSLALTVVLPLGAIIFCHGLISDPLLHKIDRNEHELETETAGSSAAAHTQSRLDAEFFRLGIITLLYVVFALAFSLLSTASIVYTVASIYTSKGLSYVKVISVVPKVWKRLFMTFLWAHILIFLYYVAFVFILFLLLFLQMATGLPVTLFFVPLLLVFYCLLVYINLVWHLASVVTVLEDSYGISAMTKSADLIKGKRRVGCVIILLYLAATILVLMLFNIFVRAPDTVASVVGRVFLGLTLLLLWTVVTLLGIVVQTIVYFVCKSVHRESIDRHVLSEHLDGYLGEYMPLKGPVISLDALEEAELEEVSPLPSRSTGLGMNKV
jgi:hypothetical protein